MGKNAKNPVEEKISADVQAAEAQDAKAEEVTAAETEKLESPVEEEVTAPDVPEAEADEAENEDEESDQVRTRALTDKDRMNIYKEFNGPEANVAAIADRYEITPEEVTAIVDEQNGVGSED